MREGSEASESLERQIDGIAVLKDPVRRSLFAYVTGAPAEVSRDQAAEAVGVNRALAAFHLDKLVDEGLLEVTFRRLTGRSGPGAGRPAKLYRRSQRELAVTLPPREYELAARLMARAMECAPATDPRQALDDIAGEVGTQIGARAERASGRAAAGRRAAVIDTLSEYGFEPYQEGDRVLLRNCPFHGLSRDHTSLVCGMNLALMNGLVAGATSSGLEAQLRPEPGRCCVVLTETGS
jgi:predicted ArsR family transcriptional regulator